jgi:hypothetical protein
VKPVISAEDNFAIVGRNTPFEGPLCYTNTV